MIPKRGDVVTVTPTTGPECGLGADPGSAMQQGDPDQRLELEGRGQEDGDLRDIDEYYNPIGMGGYRPVANTVWTWHRFSQEQQAYFLFFFALARRTDAAHVLWVAAIEARDQARNEAGIPHRQGQFNALAAAEVAIVALGRCYRMMRTLVEKYCPGMELPDAVANTNKAVREMRNAFEHIDERAESKVDRRKVDPDALTIFNQPDFVSASILRYKSYESDFETDVLPALVACRELIMNALPNAATEAGRRVRPGRNRPDGPTT